MAATPLFQTLNDVKSSLRLSNVNTDTDASIQLDRGVENARLEFWRRLGKGAVSLLVALVPKDPPETDDEHKRLLANHTELLLVMVWLVRFLPVGIRDGASDFQQLWQSDDSFKNMSDGGKSVFINEMNIQINENFDILAGLESSGSEVSVKAAVLEPQGIAEIDKFVGTSAFRFQSGGTFGLPNG
jgi:hypothetical protein